MWLLCYRSRRTRRKRHSIASTASRRRQADKRRYQHSTATSAPLSRRCSSARPINKRRRSVAMQASRWKQRYIVSGPTSLAMALVNRTRRRTATWQQCTRCRGVLITTLVGLSTTTTMMKTKYWKHKEFQIRYKSLMRAKYIIDAKYRAVWRQKMRQKTTARYAGDVKYRMAHQQKMRAKLTVKYAGDAKFRAAHQRKMLIVKHVKRANRQLQRRTDPVAAFTQHIQKGPIYTCISCHRHLYRQTVVKLNLSRYKPESGQLLSAMLAAFNSKKRRPVVHLLYLSDLRQT